MNRSANATWNGGLKDGRGSFSVGTHLRAGDSAFVVFADGGRRNFLIAARRTCAHR